MSGLVRRNWPAWEYRGLGRGIAVERIKDGVCVHLRMLRTRLPLPSAREVLAAPDGCEAIHRYLDRAEEWLDIDDCLIPLPHPASWACIKALRLSKAEEFLVRRRAMLRYGRVVVVGLEATPEGVRRVLAIRERRKLHENDLHVPEAAGAFEVSYRAAGRGIV